MNITKHFLTILLFAPTGLFVSTVSAQPTIPSGFVLPSSAADLTQPGFVWRVQQVATPQLNSNARAESQLAGELGGNVADPNAQGIAIGTASPASPATAPLTFAISGVINLNQQGGGFDGNFGPDDQMPGIPGLTGSNDYIAGEILTWLDLPVGIITLGVNSDDGFRLTIGGSSPIDRFALRVGEFDGGRPPRDSIFSFEIVQAGLYPVRCLWEEGEVGASIEMFSVNPDSSIVLINDIANGGIPAYRAVTSPARAYAQKVSPAPGSGGVRPDAPVRVELVDGASPINPSSIQLSIDGAPVVITRSKSGNVTTINYSRAVLYGGGSEHAVALSYIESAARVTATWDFTVANYVGPNGNYYEFVSAPGIRWEVAKSAAEHRILGGRSGHLATITTAEEDVYIEALRQESVAGGAFSLAAWIGGFQSANQPNLTDGWMWINGEGPIPGVNGGSAYSNWYPNEPNDCCGTFNFEDNEENYLAVGYFGVLGWIDDGNGHPGDIGGYVMEYDRWIVPIDIKPGESPNSINLDSNGKTTVAILSTATFDATKVDPSTVRFGRTGTEAAPVSYSLSDVNADKRRDLVCQFNTQDLGLMCSDTIGLLLGTTLDGIPIKGSDSVAILHCPSFGLSLVAMQKVGKVTDLYLTVSALGSGSTPPALAQTLQLKSFDIFGKQKWTKNLKNLPLTPGAAGSSVATLQFPDMEHGQIVKLKMDIKAASGGTEIVRSEGRVVFRPDVAVEGITAPAQANVHQIVNISASIRELKGDNGATGNVYLMDGANVIDVVHNGSIGPLGNVAAVFSTIFTTEGNHQLKVVVGEVVPGDYDLSNNEQSFSIQVIKPPLEPVFSCANYYHNEGDYLSVVETPYWISTYHQQYTNDSLSQTLYIPVVLGSPLSRVNLTISADGVERDNLEALDIPLFEYSFGCDLNRYGSAYLGGNISFNFQSYRDCYGNEQSYASFYKYAENTVYYSSFFDKYWGTLSESASTYGFGNLIRASDSIKTRFIVEGDAGAFGGDLTISPMSVSPINDSWDYMYFDDHYSGFNRGLYISGFLCGETAP